MFHQYRKTFSDRLLANADNFFQLISSHVLAQSPTDFVSIDAKHDRHTFIMDDGSLISAFTVRGATKAMKTEEYGHAVKELELGLKSYFSRGDTQITWSFTHDHDKTRESIEAAFGRQARETANNIGFIDTQFVDEQVDALEKYCATETNVLVVRTTLHSLTKEERIQLKELINSKTKGALSMRNAENLLHEASFYAHRHEATLKALAATFDHAGIWIDLQSVHEFAYTMRNAYDSEFTDLNWKARLQGDGYTHRLPKSGSDDYSSLGTPLIKDQLVPRMCDRLTYTSMQVGNVYITPFTVKLLPKRAVPFAQLFNELRSEGIPYRITFDLNTSSSGLLAWRSTLANLLSFQRHNSQMSGAAEALYNLKDKANAEFVSLKIHLATWSRESEREAQRQREIIIKRLSNWGQVECENVEGDPVETYISGIPGLSRGKVAAANPYELNETLQIMPLSQPASIWDSGSRLLRTPNGKLFPTQPFSKQMNYWLKVILGPMGFGKSGELAADNFSLLLHPDFKELAYLRQIDIGYTSAGFIAYVKSLLPRNQAHLAQFHRIQNTVEYMVNILDTLPVLRRPTSTQIGFIKDMLTTLTLPDDKDLPYDGTMAIINTLITTAYKKTADRRTALNYRRNVIKEVDTELERLGFFDTPRKLVLWWDVADFLYLEKSKASMLAQQQAVPDLPYLAMLTNDESLIHEFGDDLTPQGKPLLAYIGRKIQAAMEQYPILSGRTRWNLSGAKIISLDLDDVTRGKGPAALKQNAVFYTLASNLLMQDITLYPDQLKEIPTTIGIFDIEAKAIYTEEVKRLRRLAKRFCADELHRGGNIPTFESMLNTMTLEGRKGGIDIVLATQLVKAIPDDIVELANTITILGAGNSSNVREIVKKFALEPSLEYILANEMRSPSAAGAMSLNIFKTKRGVVQHPLMSTVSPSFLWRINSIQEDDYVRRELGKVIGEDVAHAILVKRYPSGTIESELERLRKNQSNDNKDSEEPLLDEIVADCLRYFKTQYVAETNLD